MTKAEDDKKAAAEEKAAKEAVGDGELTFGGLEPPPAEPQDPVEQPPLPESVTDPPKVPIDKDEAKAAAAEEKAGPALDENGNVIIEEPTPSENLNSAEAINIGEEEPPPGDHSISYEKELMLTQRPPVGKIGERDPHEVLNRLTGESQRMNLFAWFEQAEKLSKDGWFLADRGEPVAEDYLVPEDEEEAAVEEGLVAAV